MKCIKVCSGFYIGSIKFALHISTYTQFLKKKKHVVKKPVHDIYNSYMYIEIEISANRYMCTCNLFMSGRETKL